MRVRKPPSIKKKKRLAKLLGRDEEVFYVTTIGGRYFLINLVLLLFLPLAVAYLSMFLFFGYFSLPVYPWLKYLGIPALILLIYNTPKYTHLIRMRQSYTYALTNRRFLIIRGIFSRKIVTAPLDRITHITVEQSFFQRFLFNSGHLVIITAGFDQREIVIENIGNPVEFKIYLEELTRKLEDSMGADPQDNQLRALSS